MSSFFEKFQVKKRPGLARIIPCGLLQRGRHPHRSGNRHTCPCRLLPCHSPWRLPMRGIRSRRFHIRCTYRYQRLLPTRSLRLYVSFIGKKRVTITIPTRQDVGKLKKSDYLEMKIISSGPAHRSCRRCRVSSRQPSGQQQWRRLQRPSDRMHGARVRSSRSFSST